MKPNNRFFLMAERNSNRDWVYNDPIPGINVISLTATTAGITSTRINEIPARINISHTGIYDITTGSLGTALRGVAFSFIVFNCFFVAFHTYHPTFDEFEQFGSALPEFTRTVTKSNTLAGRNHRLTDQDSDLMLK